MTAVAVSVILTAAIVLSGTYAWVSLNELARNDALGEPGPAGGRLHDDFEVMEEGDWKANITANKDIYVENFESTAEGRPIFVRVKLYEYMEIGPGATELPKLDVDSDGDGILDDNPAYLARAATPLIVGALRDDVTTWTPRLPGSNINSDMFRHRWEWDMGGGKDYMPTFNKDNHSQETDIKGDAIDPAEHAGETVNATRPGEPYEYPADAGLHDFFTDNPSYSATEKYWDDDADAHAVTVSDEIHNAMPTINGSVITMAEWKAAPYNAQKGNYWVVDVDGWCYWANELMPENATALLLNSLTLRGEPDDEWYYGIFVRSQMATAADWTSDAVGGGFYDPIEEAPSADAESLLNIATGRLPAVLGVYFNQPIAAVAVNGTITLSTEVLTENTSDPAWEAVTWSITPSAGAYFNNGVFSPTAIQADKWYTVRATSAKDTAKYAEIKVYVPKATQGVLTGEDGSIYAYHIDLNDNTFQKINADGSLGSLVCPVEEGKPGASSDRSVSTIYDGHYLDTGDGKHYYGAGTDGKLGTGDDVLMYDDGTAMVLSDDTVTLTITSDKTSVAQGLSRTLTAAAIVEGDDVDVSGVTWTLIGSGYGAGTAVTGSPSGSVKLTVDADESSTSVTIRATYPGEDSVTKDYTVSVRKSLDNTALMGTYIDDNGVEWLVLSRKDGYGMVTTKYAYGPVAYTGTDTWVHLDSTTILKPALQTWYQDTAGADVKSLSVPYVSLPDTRTSIAGTFNSSDTNAAGLSSPKTDGTAITSNGSNAIFIMSVSEANTYLGGTSAKNAYYVANKSTNVTWWLRSPGNSAGQRVRWYLISETNVAGTTIAIRCYYRPCLWVKTS